jgi:hypothetical protein
MYGNENGTPPYPNDSQFEDVTVKTAKEMLSGGWSIERSDGWSFFVPADSPITPRAGMPVRFYGKGIGFPVRGLFLDGVRVFYRTEDEEKDFSEIERFGADATEWLKRWDEGRIVWTIEMGGLGPGYEQCIHVTCAELLRHMLKANYDGISWADTETWNRDRELIQRAAFDNETIDKLGLSGAQYGAALSIATAIYRRGPRDVMADPAVKDRHIQVSKNFPGAQS